MRERERRSRSDGNLLEHRNPGPTVEVPARSWSVISVVTSQAIRPSAVGRPDRDMKTVKGLELWRLVIAIVCWHRHVAVAGVLIPCSVVRACRLAARLPISVVQRCRAGWACSVRYRSLASQWNSRYVVNWLHSSWTVAHRRLANRAVVRYVHRISPGGAADGGRRGGSSCCGVVLSASASGGCECGKTDRSQNDCRIKNLHIRTLSTSDGGP